jgi:hypothetical protein
MVAFRSLQRLHQAGSFIRHSLPYYCWSHNRSLWSLESLVASHSAMSFDTVPPNTALQLTAQATE